MGWKSASAASRAFIVVVQQAISPASAYGTEAVPLLLSHEDLPCRAGMEDQL